MPSHLIEWGPAMHDPDNPFSAEAIGEAVEAVLDQRAAEGDRPDDN